MTQSVFVKSPTEKRKKLFKGSLLHNNVLFRRRGKVGLIQKAILSSFFYFIPQPSQFFAFVLLVPPPTSRNGISSELPAVLLLKSQLSFTHLSKQLERVAEWKDPGLVEIIFKCGLPLFCLRT